MDCSFLQIRNPKLEIRNKFQKKKIPNPKRQSHSNVQAIRLIEDMACLFAL